MPREIAECVDTDQSFADLLEEATRALQRDGDLDIEALVRAHPQYADQLWEVVPAMAAMASWARGSGSVSKTDEQSGTTPSPCPLPEGEGFEREVLGDFRIIREIGRGGMGVVYEAEQILLRRRVALKVLPFAAVLDKRSLQRFKNEALAAASLDHPNIVSVYFVGDERGVHFFAMQLIDGQSLAEVIAGLCERSVVSGQLSVAKRADIPATDHGQRTTDTHPVARLSTLSGRGGREYFRAVARLGVEAARALAHAHEQGVVHRDIKPGNLMLDAAGQLYITDFGLARVTTDVTMTMTGDLLGTLRYMAPEQVLGRQKVIDHRADIYSLGATLYELLALQPAFGETDRSELLRRIPFDEPWALRKHDRRIPAELETIVHKAMAKSCDDRYQSALELAEDFERFLDYKPIVGKPPGRLERCVKWARRHPAGAALVAVLFLSLVSLSIGALWHARLLSAALRVSEENRKAASVNEQKALQRERSLRNHQYAWGLKEAMGHWKARDADAFCEVMSRVAKDENLIALRSFEWDYMWNLLHPKFQPLAAHNKPLNCVAYSPNYKLLATASEDGTVAIWDANSHTLVTTLKGHTSCVNKVQFAPDGSWIATSSCDQTVKLWDAKTFAEIGSFAHKYPVFGLAISPDGRTIAAGLGNGEIQSPGKYDVVIWDVPARKRRLVLTGHEHDVRSVAFAPNGTLATASFDGTVRRWNASTGELLNTLLHPGPLYCVTYSPDGSIMISGSGIGSAIVWDQDKWQPKTIMGTKAYLQSIAVASDGMIATGNGYGLIELWNPENGTVIGQLLANNVRLVDKSRDPRIVSLVFSKDGSRIVSSSFEGVAKIFDLRKLPTVDTSLSIESSLTTLGHTSSPDMR
jgi:serine/threonine protein kinase/WD40 repeat protein